MPAGAPRLDELDRALGQRRAGSDGVHPDPVRPELERHRLRQAPDRVLRGAVVGEARPARVDGVDRGDVDDRAAVALRPHLRSRRPDAEERAADVDVEDALELLRGDILEQEVREDAGVVHEHVEPAEAVDGRVDEPLDVGRRRDVALCRHHRVTRLGEAPCAASRRSARRSASTTAAPASARRRAQANPKP